MDFRKAQKVRKVRRAKRTRAKITGNAKRPRLSVHRTNRFIYAQIINDDAMKTLAAISSKHLEKGKRTKVEEAAQLGEALGKKAKDLGITTVIFDRGSYRYHGRVKALAEGARKSGLTF
jgi:large subunit ribosomal protein L18